MYSPWAHGPWGILQWKALKEERNRNHGGHIEDDDDQDEDQLLENPLLDDILLDNLIEDSPLMPNTERSLLKPENLLDEAEAELDLMSPIKDEPRRMQAPRTYRADSYYDRAAAANEAQKSKPV